MRVIILLLFLLLLHGCASKETEFDRLSASLTQGRLASIKYADWKYSPSNCNNDAVQKLLVEWNKTLHRAGIASWPTGADMIFTFENGKEFKMNLFMGNNDLKYSVLYLSGGNSTEGGIYTGHPLQFGGACSWKER